jgi:hypothetical protein
MSGASLDTDRNLAFQRALPRLLAHLQNPELAVLHMSYDGWGYWIDVLTYRD